MFHLKNNRRNKTLYKKFLILRTKTIKNFKITKLKKKKWKEFLTIIKRQKQIKIKLKPFTIHDYIVAKFASQGNSFKKKFKNDLIAKKTFTYFYGNVMKKYLKKRMKTIYKSKSSYHYQLVCLKFFESKLTSVLYRSKFCFSIKNAQHFVSHRHIKINEEIIQNKSYILKEGDLIKVKPQSFYLIRSNIKKTILENIQLKTHRIPFKKLKTLTEFFNLLWPLPPKYLIINYKTLEIVFNSIQSFNFSIYFPFKMNLQSIIINYYTH